MFDYEHAVQSLKVVKDVLFGKLGIKTLDPADWAYRGFYDNANDSNDPTVAHGFNYHQGPVRNLMPNRLQEWGWIQFFFLRAYLKFERMSQDERRIIEANNWIRSVLQTTYQRHIADSAANPIAGLPELTNAGGDFCPHSCLSQAWSNSCMMELIVDLIQQRGIYIEV